MDTKKAISLRQRNQVKACLQIEAIANAKVKRMEFKSARKLERGRESRKNEGAEEENDWLTLAGK